MCETPPRGQQHHVRGRPLPPAHLDHVARPEVPPARHLEPPLRAHPPGPAPVHAGVGGAAAQVLARGAQQGQRQQAGQGRRRAPPDGDNFSCLKTLCGSCCCRPTIPAGMCRLWIAGMQ